LQRAARLIYLNRTAFNGLYRVNKRGEFNVPFGCKSGTVVCESEKIRACSTLLRRAKLQTMDFRLLFPAVTPEDDIYIDPPYTVSHGSNGFRHYNERLFSWEDQLALARHANDVVRKGGRVAVSNALHSDILQLYPRNLFRPFLIIRQSQIAGDARYRGRSKELLLVSHSLLTSGDLPKKLKLLPVPRA
jgi:DNA adenine methylase